MAESRLPLHLACNSLFDAEIAISYRFKRYVDILVITSKRRGVRQSVHDGPTKDTNNKDTGSASFEAQKDGR
ncbi:hypothetical protein HBH98_134440 [Parastagonospora nodorum]|nr:hypothetical protein HBH51_178370 [Parastagonospora nodorum]KAH3997931.1 hypothetical protein HBI10_137590 [Parastagonospora nodorum]KAH4020439.1 hypothetical protein HBI13_114860 [Parastagonospora nodorum]KAH4048035.1 hypothetical protein HBH49_163580 [Parastagonospora nodorum]KAH4101964.1 hypothetical protein HBH46_135080 [Parastagonospora nodorum]